MNKYKFDSDSLIENVEYVYYRDKNMKLGFRSFYSLACITLIQTLIGNEKSIKFSCIVGSISSILTLISIINKRHFKNYKRVKNKLKDVSLEILLLGYDIDENAIFEGIFDELYNTIEFYDKHDNKYYIYEKERKYYLLHDNKIIEKLLNDECSIEEIEQSLINKNNYTDATEEINRGLSKTK